MFIKPPFKTAIMACKVKRICLIVSPLALFLLFFQVAHSQADTAGISAKFPQYQKLAGRDLDIMIYKDGKVIYSKASPDFPTNTQARIGSSGKWLVAAMLLMLVDEGKVGLDEKITKYLPIYQTYGKAYITIRHCLDNMTGIEGDRGDGVGNGGLSLEALVDSYASKHEIETNAGTEYKYSNIGINIAARIIEVVSKRDFEQVMQQRLFRPLGMRNTTFQFNYGNGLNPAVGAYSTAADYISFLSMLLNKGIFKGKRVMSEKAVAMMTAADVSPNAMKNTPKAVTGLAWAPGAWVLEQDGNGKPTCIASPSLTGIWPVLDLCRGYASIIFIKDVQPDGNKPLFTQVKELIDAGLPCNN